MVKVLVIGCGRIAGNSHNNNFNTHGEVYDSLDNVSIVGCIDKDNEKAQSYSKKYKCNSENDLELSLAKYKPQIVSVCTSDKTHYEITEKLLLSVNAPMVIFLEKPICHKDFELKRLIQLSKKKNIEVIVNFTRRFDHHYVELRDRIMTNHFGVLRKVYATYYSGWEHNGVHHIDTLSFLFNDAIEVVSITEVKDSKYKHDPSISLVAKFSNMPGKIYFNTFDENDYQLFDLELQFDKSRVRFEDFGARIIVENHHINSIGENVIKLESNSLNKKTETAMQHAINLICKSIENGNREILDGYRISDSVKTMNAIWQGKKMYEKYRFN